MKQSKAEDNSSNKRRKLSAGGSDSSSSSICLSDHLVPIGALAHVSSYLPLPSRALFVSALICSNDMERCSAIVGDQRDVLDFGNIEKELAVKLKDDDVKNILLSIDAVNNLKTLRLTNLLNITGVGLEPIRGSTTIEKIDLSLVGDHESPELKPAPPISCPDILPILDSIIERGGASSLKLLTFPLVWRQEGSHSESGFHSFLTRYNALLSSRESRCMECNCNLADNVRNQMLDVDAGTSYGVQACTCYNCMKRYCYECEDEGTNNFLAHRCGMCNRVYCLHCQKMIWCKSCGEMMCVDCMDFKDCSNCEVDTCRDCVSERSCNNNCGVDKIWCESCVDEEDALRSCDFCGVDYCGSCCDSDVHTVKFCDVCQISLCGQCVVEKCKQGRVCTGCYQLAFPVLLKENERIRNENSELKRIAAMREARNELNELKCKVDYMEARLEEDM